MSCLTLPILELVSVTGLVWLTGTLKFSLASAKGPYSMPAPYCPARQPSATMKETQHPRVGVSECWLKPEAPIQLVSLTEEWGKGANQHSTNTGGRIPQLFPALTSAIEARKEVGVWKGPSRCRTLGCSQALCPLTAESNVLVLRDAVC